MRPCFFIVGCPRSGTTLLRRMLAAHPRIAVTPESHFGERYVRKAGRFGAPGDPARHAALLDDFCASRGFGRSRIGAQAFKDEARRSPDDPWSPLRIWMDAFARQEGAEIVGEKTPSHALFLPALAHAFPKARFVGLRRDPRAVVTSWERVAWSRRSAAEAAEIWRRYSAAMGRAQRKLGPRFLELRYEELTSSPETQLGRVCRLLDVEFDPAMMAYHEGLRADPSSEAHGLGSRTLGPVDPSRAAVWRGEIDRATLRQIEAVCGREMARRGYPLESSRLARWAVMLGTCPPLWRKRALRMLRSSRSRSESQ